MSLIQDDLKALALLKEEYRRLYKLYTDAKEAHDIFERDVFTKMRDQGVLTMRMTDGVYSAKSTVYAQVQDIEQFSDWCREMDLDSEFLKTKEVAARLNEYVRNALDTGEALPPGVGWYPKDYVAITSA